MALELFGVGVASRNHRGELGDAQIGLAQSHSMSAGQAIEPFDGRVHSAASVGNVMGAATAASAVWAEPGGVLSLRVRGQTLLIPKKWLDELVPRSPFREGNDANKWLIRLSNSLSTRITLL